MKQTGTVYMVVLLGFLAAIAPLSTDMYLPALPTMDAEFAVGTSAVQMTLAATMVGMAIGQLFAGPVSDRFGRKTPLVIGMVLFTLTTFGCATADTMAALLVFRFIQGMSGSFGIVVARAIARDVYSGYELTRFVSMLMLVNGLAPVLAPIIGGQILRIATWRWIFVVLAAVGVVLVLAALRLRETLPDKHRMKNMRTGFAMFGVLLRDRYFLGHCIIQCTIFAAFFGYISGSPFLFQNIYHVSPQTYSLIFGGLGVCMVFAGLVPVRLAGRVADIRMMAWAAGEALVGSIAFLACVVFQLSILWAILSLAVIVCTIPIFGAASFSLAMRNHRKEAGAASALFGFSSMFASGAAAPLVGLGGSDTALPMAALMLVGELCTFLVFWRMVWQVHRRGYAVAFGGA